MRAIAARYRRRGRAGRPPGPPGSSAAGGGIRRARAGPTRALVVHDQDGPEGALLGTGLPGQLARAPRGPSLWPPRRRGRLAAQVAALSAPEGADPAAGDAARPCQALHRSITTPSVAVSVHHRGGLAVAERAGQPFPMS